MGRDSHQSAMVEARMEQASSTEPIVTRTRNATPNGQGVRCNLTKVGKDVHDIESGDPLEVEVYPDGIWIEPKDGE